MLRMRALVISGLIAIATGRISAQSETATIAGRVTDRSTGRGIAHARLVLLSDSRSITTDSVGRYEFRRIPAGVSRLMVLAEPFPTINFVVTLAATERVYRDVVLDSTAAGRVQALPEVGVTASAPVTDYRMVG